MGFTTRSLRSLESTEGHRDKGEGILSFFDISGRNREENLKLSASQSSVNSVSSSADESARVVKKSTPQKIDISVATKMILGSISPNKHSSCATKNITFTAQHKRPLECGGSKPKWIPPANATHHYFLEFPIPMHYPQD